MIRKAVYSVLTFPINFGEKLVPAVEDAYNRRQKKPHGEIPIREKGENRKELGRNPEKLRDFLEEYREIERYLEKEFLEKDQEIMFRDIVELISRIGNHILRDEEQVKERFGEVMGGKVLELESDKLIKQGIEQGMERERENTERERKNAEKALQKVKEAEEEIRRLKQLLLEKGAGHTEE